MGTFGSPATPIFWNWHTRVARSGVTGRHAHRRLATVGQLYTPGPGTRGLASTRRFTCSATAGIT